MESKLEGKQVNYFNALNFIYNTLQVQNKLSTQLIVKNFKIDPQTFKLLQTGGILKKTGNRNNTLWEWKSIRPNHKMAQELYNRVLDYNRQRFKNSYEERKQLRQESQRKNNTSSCDTVPTIDFHSLNRVNHIYESKDNVIGYEVKFWFFKITINKIFRK